MIGGSGHVETKTLAIIRAVSTSLVAVLATLGVQYPHWVWVPITAGVVSVINLNVIPAVTAALAPTPAVQVQLTPVQASPKENPSQGASQ